MSLEWRSSLIRGLFESHRAHAGRHRINLERIRALFHVHNMSKLCLDVLCLSSTFPVPSHIFTSIEATPFRGLELLQQRGAPPGW